MQASADRGHLLTEMNNPRSAGLDALSIGEAFDVMNAEDRRIAEAVAAARPAIVAAIELITARLRNGGRMFYVGAGTSGRLGVLDAAECPPTFLSDPELIQGVIAGGDVALKRAVERAEDFPEDAARDLAARGLSSRDVVFGIAAGGTTPYVHGALDAGRRVGAGTVMLACVPFDDAPDQADVSIRILTGPEVLTGSTRLKAGLGTKMVLNAISTLTMVQLGKVYGNWMVDVNALACSKLVDRAQRIVSNLTGLPRDAARALLERAEWHVKTAVVMHALSVDAPAARQALADHNQSIRAVLAAANGSAK